MKVDKKKLLYAHLGEIDEMLANIREHIECIWEEYDDGKVWKEEEE